MTQVKADVGLSDVVPNVIPVTSNPHAEAAQLRLEELRKWREQIPRFAIPETSDATQRLTPAAIVPPVFIELTNVAVANQIALVRADGTPPAEIRDLVAYADAYVTLADELEAEAHFIRYSTTAARNLAGTEALTTYSLAQRLFEAEAVRPSQTARRRHARKAAERAVKAAAKVARTGTGAGSAVVR